MIEPLLFLVFLAIAAAAVIPYALRAEDRQRHSGSAECIQNLLLLEEGHDPSQFVCPIANRPYLSEIQEDEQTLSCPDPDRHLRVDLSLVRHDESWEKRRWLFEKTMPSGGVVELENTRTYLEDRPEALIIQNPPPRPLVRYFLLPIATVGSFCVFLLAAGFLVDSLRSGGLGLGDLVALVFLVVGLAATSRWIHEGIHRQEITVYKQDRTLIVQDYYFGRASKNPQVLRSVRGIFPVFSGENFSVIAFYGDQDQLARRTLFESSGPDWEAVAILNGPFLPGQPD